MNRSATEREILIQLLAGAGLLVIVAAFIVA
jgi:hypothetical protein